MRSFPPNTTIKADGVTGWSRTSTPNGTEYSDWAHELVTSAVGALTAHPSLSALAQAQQDALIRIAHEGFYAAPHLKEPPRMESCRVQSDPRRRASDRTRPAANYRTLRR